jgi:hypothetical protein
MSKNYYVDGNVWSRISLDDRTVNHLIRTKLLGLIKVDATEIYSYHILDGVLYKIDNYDWKGKVRTATELDKAVIMILESIGANG